MLIYSIWRWTLLAIHVAASIVIPADAAEQARRLSTANIYKGTL